MSDIDEVYIKVLRNQHGTEVKLLLAAILILTMFVGYLLVVMATTMIPMYQKDDLYYIYPFKNKIATESRIETLSFQNFKQMTTWIEDKTADNCSYDLDIMNYVSVQYYPADTSVQLTLDDPFADTSYTETLNSRDIFGDHIQFYLTD